MAFEPLPYRTFSTWVSSSGWNEVVIATPRVRSTSRGTLSVTDPSSASELVRVRWPSRSESRGSSPMSFIAWSSFWVPQAPAATTTWRAVMTRGSVRTQAPVRSWRTR